MMKFRTFIFSAFMALTLFVLGIILLPLLLLGKGVGVWIAKQWISMNLAALRLLTGVSHRIDARGEIPETGCIVAANHQSMWEALALFVILPKPVMIFKEELLRIPIFGLWIRAVGNISIDRRGGAKALRKMRAAARQAIENGAQIVVFPEGTRVAPGETRPFQSGIAGIYAAADAPCVPVVHNSGEHWRHPDNQMRPGEIIIRFLPALPKGMDRRAFLSALEKTITDHRIDLQHNANRADAND